MDLSQLVERSVDVLFEEILSASNERPAHLPPGASTAAGQPSSGADSAPQRTGWVELFDVFHAIMTVDHMFQAWYSSRNRSSRQRGRRLYPYPSERPEPDLGAPGVQEHLRFHKRPTSRPDACHIRSRHRQLEAVNRLLLATLRTAPGL